MKGDHRWREHEPVEKEVQRVLPKMTEKWFAAGEIAMQPGVSWEDMHRFRLLSKRFRYSLEIFAPLYGPALEERIALLRKLQNFLGDINDCVTARLLLGADDPGTVVESSLAARAEAKTAELHSFWQKNFSGPEAVASWTRYLSRYAGRAKRHSKRSATR